MEARTLTEVEGGRIYALSTEGAVQCRLDAGFGPVCTDALAPEGTPLRLEHWDPLASGSAMVVATQEDGDLQLCEPHGLRCARVPFLDGLRSERLPPAARGDVDGDGHDDLVFARPRSPDQAVVSPHLCWGGPRLSDLSCTALDIVGDHFGRASLADIDHDAHLDLLLGVSDNDAWTAPPQQCLGDGAGGFFCEETAFTGETGTDAIAEEQLSADLDGDGQQDRLVRFVAEYRLRPVWCPGSADTRFPCQHNAVHPIAVPERYYSDGVSYPVGVEHWTPIDLDDDGDLDLLGIEAAGALVDCRFDGGAYDCGPLVDTPCTEARNQTELSVVDLDGDGDVDVVTTCKEVADPIVVVCVQQRGWTCEVMLDDATWLGSVAWPATVSETEVWE